MKTLAVVTAALAISLTFAGTASADSVTMTKTDRFGNQTSFTQNNDGHGHQNKVITQKDAFGRQRTIIQNNSDNGLVRCQFVTVRNSNALGDSVSSTRRRCALDGADF
jgi:hypothetical protein